MNIQNMLLARVVSMLDGVAQHQNASQEKRKKRKATMKSTRSRKRVKTSHTTYQNAGTLGEDDVAQPEGGDGEELADEPIAVPPAVLQHLVIGINEVTKTLESLARAFRESVSADDPTKEAPRHDSDNPHGRIVLVCKEDVDPPILIDHLPNLVAACNSARHRSSTPDVTWMVPLSKGTESTLADGLGLRRASVMIIEVSSLIGPSTREILKECHRVVPPASPSCCPCWNLYQFSPRHGFTHL